VFIGEALPCWLGVRLWHVRGSDGEIRNGIFRERCSRPGGTGQAARAACRSRNHDAQ